MDGQEALDNSTPIKQTSERRVGVDSINKEVVVLDPNGKGSDKFHGHVQDKITDAKTRNVASKLPGVKVKKDGRWEVDEIDSK